MKSACTTCGATDFRAGVIALKDSIVAEISFVDLQVLKSIPNWGFGLNLALDELPKSLLEPIYVQWHERLDDNCDIADWILFYWVRPDIRFTGMSSATRTLWIETCIRLAITTRNESLVESLVYTICERVRDIPELLLVVADLEKSSRPVALAVERSIASE